MTRIIQLIAVLGGANLLVGASNLFLYFLHSNSVSLLGFINLALGLLCAWGVLRLCRQNSRLKKEETLFE